MRLVDYYRQFEGLSEQEVNLRKRADADERKRRALARVEPLDLSQTTWPGLPHPYVVNAVTFVARRGLQRYPRRDSNELRSELAHRHDIEPARVAIGNGAAQLLSTAAQALLEPGQELICPWPGYPLMPLMAARARGRAVPIPASDGDGLLAAVNEHTRIVALANPDDPTGAILDQAQLRRLLESLPEQVAVLLDEALIDFTSDQPAGSALALLDEHPRLIVFRSFSKAWGLAGLRCGYALGGPGSEELLSRLEPELGIGDLAQVGALESLRSAAGAVAQRSQALAAERDRLADELRGRGLDVPPSQANFLWVAHPRLDGAALADALGSTGVLVAPGGPLGDASRVRITVRDRAASDRLLRAVDTAEAR